MAATIGDATLLLDIQVHQLPRPLTLVADHLPGGPVQLAKARHPMPDQHPVHCGVGLPERPADPVGADPVGGPIGQDGLLTGGWQPPGAGVGPAATVGQAGLASARQRPSHLYAVAADTPWASAARAGGQPCWQIRWTNSHRPCTVSFALGWAMRASLLGTWTVLSEEALTS